MSDKDSPILDPQEQDELRAIVQGLNALGRRLGKLGFSPAKRDCIQISQDLLRFLSAQPVPTPDAPAPTCGWYAEDDDGEMIGDVCGVPATHYSCNVLGVRHPTGRNACIEHKCRCGR